jgi:serine/threonine protein kinase
MAREPWSDVWVKGKHLGKGGQGLTYMARRAAANSKDDFVLKLLIRQEDQERRARFYQEVCNLRSLDHPNLAKYADSNTERYKQDETGSVSILIFAR